PPTQFLPPPPPPPHMQISRNHICNNYLRRNIHSTPSAPGRRDIDPAGQETSPAGWPAPRVGRFSPSAWLLREARIPDIVAKMSTQTPAPTPADPEKVRVFLVANERKRDA